MKRKKLALTPYLVETGVRESEMNMGASNEFVMYFAGKPHLFSILIPASLSIIPRAIYTVVPLYHRVNMNLRIIHTLG